MKGTEWTQTRHHQQPALICEDMGEGEGVPVTWHCELLTLNHHSVTTCQLSLCHSLAVVTLSLPVSCHSVTPRQLSLCHSLSCRFVSELLGLLKCENEVVGGQVRGCGLEASTHDLLTLGGA